MGIADAWAALWTKRQTSPGKVLASSVRPTDAMVSRYGRTRQDAASIESYVSWAGICASLNASQTAAVPMRVYRRVEVRGGKSRRTVPGWHGRPVAKSQLAFMRAQRASKAVADFAQTADELEEITDGPLIDLLNNPNPWMNSTQFWEATQIMLELTGKAYQHPVVGSDPQLWLMPSQYVTVIPSQSDLIEAYVYGRGSENEQVFAPDEVLYYRHRIHPWRPWDGLGPLQMVVRDAEIDEARDEYNVNAWRNGLSMSGIVMFEQGTTEAQMLQVLDTLNGLHGGTQNAGKLGGLAGGKDIKPIGMKPSDMMAESGDDPTVRKILAAFGVPESLVFLNDANLASSTTGNAQYQRQTLLPRVAMLADMVTQRIIPTFMDIEPGDVICAPDNPVQEDDTERRTTMLQGVSAGVLTVNEWRQEFGYDPIEGGDDLTRPGAAVPAGATSSPTALAPGGVIRLSMSAADLGLVKAEPAPSTQMCADARPAHADTPEPVVFHVEQQKCNHPKRVSARDLWTKADIGNDPAEEREQEDPAYAALNEAFAEILRQTLARMADAPHGTNKGNHRQFVTKDDDDRLPPEMERVLSDWVLDSETLRGIVDGRLSPVVRLQLQESATTSLREISEQVEITVPDEFNLTRDPALRALEAYDAARSERLDEIVQGMADRLRATLAEGLRAGETFDGLTHRVEAEFVGDVDAAGLTIGERRAAMIARTETAFAQGQGRIIGDMESGVVTGKRWQPAGIVCEFCARAAQEFGDGGKSVPLGEPFYPLGTTVRGTQGGTMVVDFVPIDHPPLHPNCRCTYTRIIG